MTKITTRTNQYSDKSATLYLAFELSSSEWKLGFSTGLGQKGAPTKHRGWGPR